MRREHRVSDRVFAHLYPQPTGNDPTSFGQHLNANLVSEVRIETQRFYGGLETVEARYPGLNYTHPPHIKRLSYFPHHARLFQAFKELGLTKEEILTLCRWEGTLWARQRYEKDEGVKVQDTTGIEIKRWQPKTQQGSEQKQVSSPQRANRPVSRRNQMTGQRGQRISSGTTLPLQLQAASSTEEGVVQTQQQQPQQPPAARDVEMHDEVDSVNAIGQRVNDSQPMTVSEASRRMQALAAMREQNQPFVLEAVDPEFEQYFKDSLEEQSAGEPSSLAGDLATGNQAAHQIAMVMNAVAHAPAAPSGAEAASNVNGPGVGPVSAVNVS